MSQDDPSPVKLGHLSGPADVEAAYAELEKPRNEWDAEKIKSVIDGLVLRLAIQENPESVHLDIWTLVDGMAKFTLPGEIAGRRDVDLHRYSVFETDVEFYAFEKRAEKSDLDQPAREHFIRIWERDREIGYDSIESVNRVLACTSYFPEGSPERSYWLRVLREGLKFEH